jgi:hypothetical protein
MIGGSMIDLSSGSPLVATLEKILETGVIVRYHLDVNIQTGCEFFTATVLVIPKGPPESTSLFSFTTIVYLAETRSMPNKEGVNVHCLGSGTAVGAQLSKLLETWQGNVQTDSGHWMCWVSPEPFVGTLRIIEKDPRAHTWVQRPPSDHESFGFYNGILYDRINNYARELSENSEASLEKKSAGRQFSQQFRAFLLQSRQKTAHTRLHP